MKTRSEREMDRLQRMFVRRRALARWHLRLVRIYTESMERVNREIGRIAREAERGVITDEWSERWTPEQAETVRENAARIRRMTEAAREKRDKEAEAHDGREQ